MGLGAVSYSLFIVIMALSGIICEIKQDIGKKIVIFSYPLTFGGPRSNIATPCGVGKLEWWGYPIVKKL